MQEAVLGGDAPGRGGVTGVGQGLVQGAGGGEVEGVAGHGPPQVIGGVGEAAGAGQGAAESGARGRQVGPQQRRFQAVAKVPGQVREQRMQPPAQQVALGRRLGRRVAGIRPTAPLPFDAEVVEGDRGRRGQEPARRRRPGVVQTQRVEKPAGGGGRRLGMALSRQALGLAQAGQQSSRPIGSCGATEAGGRPGHVVGQTACQAECVQESWVAAAGTGGAIEVGRQAGVGLGGRAAQCLCRPQ